MSEICYELKSYHIIKAWYCKHRLLCVISDNKNERTLSNFKAFFSLTLKKTFLFEIMQKRENTSPHSTSSTNTCLTNFIYLVRGWKLLRMFVPLVIYVLSQQPRFSPINNYIYPHIFHICHVIFLLFCPFSSSFLFLKIYKWLSCIAVDWWHIIQSKCFLILINQFRYDQLDPVMISQD